MTNTVEFPALMNDRADKLGRHSAFQGWYPEARLGSVVFRIQSGAPYYGSPSCPIGIVFPDDSWELRSPGEGQLLAAGRNYAWVSQGFPTPEIARTIQHKGARPPRGFKAAPAPKKCNWCESTERTQPVGMQGPSDKKPRQVWTCPAHLADAFNAARRCREGEEL